MVRLLPDNRVECPKCKADRDRVAANATGIPARFIACGFDDYEAGTPGQVAALRTAKGYADLFGEAKADGTGLVFLGGVGTGKTHLACAIANTIRERGNSVLYSTARHAVGAIKDSWRQGSPYSEHETARRFVSPDLLVLDEIGVQFGTDTERLLLFDIIDGRYREMRPTIVISNLGLAEMEQVVGLRVVDRLRENGQLVQFLWPSHRR
jgi:DNA replication protein DnaC